MSDEQSDERSDIYGTLAEGGQFYRRVGARLTEPQDESVLDLSGGSMPPAMHRGAHAFDKAHVVMLAERGLIPREAAVAILETLRDMEAEGLVEQRQSEGHSIHSGEAYLIDTLGEATGGHIHLARSSHDLAAVSTRLGMRQKILTLLEAAFDLLEAYADRAGEYDDAVVSTFTGSQHAQVATFGFYLLSWARSLERDTERLIELYDRVNTSPAGAAVGTTSDFPIDRSRTAELLGFDGVLDNAEDVDKSVDVTLEAGTTLAILMASLGQVASTMQIWYSREYDLVEMSDRYAGTSSIMPQKKNPHTIQNVQRDTNGVIGQVMDLFVSAKNIGGGCRLPFEVFDTTISAVETWTAFIEDLEFDVDRGEAMVYEDWALATDLSGMLVREADLPWRTAHQITAILVRQVIENDRSVTDVTSADVDTAARTYFGEPLGVDDSVLDSVLDAHRAVEARADVTGSPAPEQVASQITQTRDVLDAGRATLAEKRRAIDAAQNRLDAAVEAIVDGDVTVE